TPHAPQWRGSVWKSTPVHASAFPTPETTIAAGSGAHDTWSGATEIVPMNVVVCWAPDGVKTTSRDSTPPAAARPDVLAPGKPKWSGAVEVRTTFASEPAPPVRLAFPRFAIVIVR